MKEYKILKDGKTWTDRYDSEDLAIEDMIIDEADFLESVFEVVEMTQEEIDFYMPRSFAEDIGHIFKPNKG